MNVSQRLIEFRTICGLTQNGLAERAGVSQTHLRRVELGEADITVGHLQLLCDAMDITLCDFFNVGVPVDELDFSLSRLTPKQRNHLSEFLNSMQR